jgi:hypothetical protein
MEKGLQREIAGAVVQRLVPDGVLIVGKHGALPAGVGGFSELSRHLRIYRKPVVTGTQQRGGSDWTRLLASLSREE